MGFEQSEERGIEYEDGSHGEKGHLETDVEKMEGIQKQHVTNEIKDFIYSDVSDEDFVLCEIGGTVGDIEGQPYLEAIRQVAYDLGRDRVMFIHVTLLPYIPAAGELKTKPTQHSVKKLQEYGIQPDMLLCRSQTPIPQNEKRKIALFCNIREDNHHD